MPKLPLPASFSDGVFRYELVYVPGMGAEGNARYAVEPNTQTMRAVSANTKVVQVPGVGQQVLTWVLMEQPARVGSAVPARMFRFFRLSKMPIPLDLLRPVDCICYAMTPLQGNGDPEQEFVNQLFGQGQKVEEKSSWASDLFEPPKEEQEDGSS